jgi:hypothetical protein
MSGITGTRRKGAVESYVTEKMSYVIKDNKECIWFGNERALWQSLARCLGVGFAG